jgi:hypothetical protein
LDKYLLRPETSLISCNIFPGISDHNGVLMEVEWDIFREPKIERTVPVYHKTDVLSLQTFRRGKFSPWAGNCSYIVEIQNNYQDIIFEGIDPLYLKKLLNKKVWVKEFLLGSSQRVRVHEQLTEEVRVNSGVPQGSLLNPLLLFAYVNDIWRNIEYNTRKFAVLPL